MTTFFQLAMVCFGQIAMHQILQLLGEGMCAAASGQITCESLSVVEEVVVGRLDEFEDVDATE